LKEGDKVAATVTGLSGAQAFRVCVAVGGGLGAYGLDANDAVKGGGASGVSVGGDFTQPVVVAGGGGGGALTFAGGDAGYPVGEPGAGTTTNSGGAGGTASAGGVGGDGSFADGGSGAAPIASGPGSGGVGGGFGFQPSFRPGGGGGAGYFGGGAGGSASSSTPAWGAGGGGSDFCATTPVSGLTALSCDVTPGAGTQTTAGDSAGFARVQLTPQWSPTITSPDSIDCNAGEACAFNVTTPASGYPVASLSVAGALPPGMTFTDNGDGTAKLSGTSTAAGTFPLTITAANGVPGDATQAFTINVAGAAGNDPPPPPPPGGGPAPLPTLTKTVLKPNRKGRLRLALACPGTAPIPCAGKISVLAKKLNVFEQTFEISPGASQTLTQKSSRKVKRALKRKRKIKGQATVSASASGAFTPSTATYDVTLKRGRAKRGRSTLFRVIPGRG
jgi:hypothetical protein